MVDTAKIRENLGTRDSIGLKRKDVEILCAIHDHYMANYHSDDKHVKVPSDFEANIKG